MDALTPLTAASASDPFSYYDALCADAPFSFDEAIGAWVASNAAAVDVVLDDARMWARPSDQLVPTAIQGTEFGDVFGRLVRMNDGDRHTELRGLVTDVLAHHDDESVYRIACEIAASWIRDRSAIGTFDLNDYIFAVPTATMATIVGITYDAATQQSIRDFARAMSPGSDAEDAARGISAVAALRASLARADADMMANLIGFLFQNYDATAGLIGGVIAGNGWDEPSVHTTRRFAAADTDIVGHRVTAGQSVICMLAAAHRDPQASRSYAFGAGRHMCPGMRIALVIARAVVDTFHANHPGQAPAVVGYWPLQNIRIPRFDGATQNMS